MKHTFLTRKSSFLQLQKMNINFTSGKGPQSENKLMCKKEYSPEKQVNSILNQLKTTEEIIVLSDYT